MKRIQNEETFGGYIGSSGSECGYVGSGLWVTAWKYVNDQWK